MILKFFDYLFYRVSSYYIYKWDDDTGSIYGIGLVSIMQLIHVVFLKLIAAFISDSANEYLFERKEGLNFLESGIIYTVLIIFAFNLLRYLRLKKFDFLETLWKDEEPSRRKRRGWIIISYIVLNLSITISISIYRRYFYY